MAENEELKRAKFGRVYGKPCRVVLPGGCSATVDRFEMTRTYAGMIEGIPRQPNIEQRISEALTYVNEHWKRPKTVVIPPDILDPKSKTPVLPTLTMMAQLTSLDSCPKGDHGAWLNIVWFADVDDEKTISEFVAEALKHIVWSKQAEGFLF